MTRAGPGFADLVRARLRALLERHHTTPTGVAKAMGLSKTTILRKLKGERALLLEDIEAMQKHLGEPWDAVLRPVLCNGDLVFLRTVTMDLFYDPASVDTPDVVLTLGGSRRLFSGWRGHLRRLVAEGLLSTVPPHDDIDDDTADDTIITLTKRGRAHLRATQTRS